MEKEAIATAAARFWEVVNGARLFAFHGPMGAGKTTFITALCRCKGVHEAMGSPTFSIINEYSFLESGQPRRLFHIDLYRLKDEEEVVQAGVEDCVYGEALCLVEWPEKAPWLFEDGAVHVFLEPVSETARHVRIKLPSPQ